MAQTNQKKQILVICGTALVLCGAAVGGGFYATGLVDEVEGKVEARKQEIAAAEAKIVRIPSVEKDVVILRENLDEYVKILPDNKELTDFIRMLYQFERQSGVVSSGLQLKKGAKGGNKRFALIEYSYSMSATLWEMMRFINLVENYDRFVNISEFQITPGKGDTGDDESVRNGDEVHSIRLTLQTYKYNGKSAAKEVKIPNYGKLAKNLREEIFRRRQAIRIEKYEYRGRGGRRDIFVDPRFRGDLGEAGVLSPAEQRTILERFVGEAEKLRGMLDRIKKGDTTLFEQYALEKGLREGLAALSEQIEGEAAKITYAPYRVRWSNEVVKVVEELDGSLEAMARGAAEQDPYLPMDEMKHLVDQMKQECENGYLEEARQRYETVAQQIQVPEEDPRYDLSVEAKVWHTKIVTAIDFSALQLEIGGVVVDHRGHSGVLLNGEVYEEGELVSEELLVKKVEEEQVWFVFRGLTLVKTM